MILRVARLFFGIALVAAAVRIWFVVVCGLAALLIFDVTALVPATIIAVALLLLRGFSADIRNRYCDMLVPRFRDLFAYRHHAAVHAVVHKELPTEFRSERIRTFVRYHTTAVRMSMYSLVIFPVIFTIFPSLFIPVSTPITVFIPLPDTVRIGSSVTVGVYSPEQQHFTVSANGQVIASQYGSQLKHTLLIHEDTHVVVTADKETHEKIIRVRALPTIHDLRVAVIAPAYMRKAGLTVPEGYAVRGSMWHASARTSSSTQEIIITNGGEYRHPVQENAFRISVPLQQDTVLLAVRDDHDVYTIGTFAYTLLDDNPPHITTLGATENLYYSMNALPVIHALLSDDWGITGYTLRSADTIVRQETLQGNEYRLEYTLESAYVSNGATVQLDLTDCKGQTSSVTWTLRFISEEVRNERITDFVDQLSATTQESDEKLAEMTDALQRTIDDARLQGDITKEQQESLKEMQDHIADMQKTLEDSLPLLDKDQERYVREIAMPELRALAQEIAELLKTTTINELQQRTEKIEKKMDSVAQSLKNFRDALLRMKKTQELNTLISDIEKASHDREIQEKLGDFLKKTPDPMVENAAAAFAEKKNKEQLLESLKTLRDLMSGKANEELKEVMLRIAKEAITWSEKFEDRIRNGSASSRDIIAMKDMLDAHSTLLNTMGAGMLYVSPGVIYTLSELHAMVDRIRISGFVQYKPLYDTHVTFITHVLKTLAQAEQRSQQLDAGQMAQMLKDILGEQQSITKDAGTPQEGQDGTQMSESLQKRQQELADKMGELRKRSDGGTQQRAGALEEEMRKSAEEKDLSKKKGQSKALELKLEKFISDIQSGDPSEKRKRELAERLLTGKKQRTQEDPAWKKKVREFRKQNNDKEFGYEIDRYYRRLLDK